MTAAAAPDRKRDIRIALGLSIGAMVALGFSRFAYALLLPPMRESLGWTFVQAGGLNTANAVGYIGGALAAAWSAKRWGMARPFQIGLSVSAVILLLSAVTSNFTLLFVLRAVGGVSTAFAFILGAGLASAISVDRTSGWSGLLVGVYVAGTSLGIVLSGITVPVVLASGAGGWRAGWVILGGLAVLGIMPAWRAADAVPIPARHGEGTRVPGELRRLVPTFLSYGLFGAGYAGYMTFVIALVRGHGGSGLETGLFWVVLGLSSTVFTLVWSRRLGHFHGGRGPAAVLAVTMLGALPVLISPGLPAAFVSAVLFGSSFMAGPTAITIVAKHHLHAASVTIGIALLTAGFALGQAIGPLLSGAITDATGSLSAGLWTSPALLLLGALISLLQKPHQLSFIAKKR